MKRFLQFAATILFFTLLAPLYSWQSAWRDPSPHTVRLVAVDNGVQLEVLDWGGSGRAIVFLAGGGNTAHVFDEFAPKLTDSYHVYGLTRRGFGASGFSPGGNGIDRLRDDVIAVMDTLKLEKPVLVGHSFGGAELSAVAVSHPNRVAGLIYIEAGYPYAFDNGTGPTNKEFQDIVIKAPQPPAPADSDLASFTTLQNWDAETHGFRMPEAEFRQTWESSPDGRPIKARDFPGSQILGAVLAGNKRFSNIPVPALAFFAIPHIPDNWTNKSTNAAVRDSARAAFAAVDLLVEKQVTAFESGARTARVMRLKGTHYLFLSDEVSVLREMRVFLAGLR